MSHFESYLQTEEILGSQPQAEMHHVSKQSNNLTPLLQPNVTPHK